MSNQDTQKIQSQDSDTNKREQSPRPNELGGFQYSTFLKITDPNSGQVLLQTRGE